MQLIHHPASPFARKARVAVLELGLGDAVELVRVDLTLGKYNEAVAVHNPLGKVPTLVTDDGEILFDSHVICDYLDAFAGGHRLVPAAGRARWRILRLHALADGITEAGQLLRQETVVRPRAAHDAGWMALQSDRIAAGRNLGR